MVLKKYIFNKLEINLIANALSEYYKNEFKDSDCDDTKLSLIALKNQFIDDLNSIIKK